MKRAGKIGRLGRAAIVAAVGAVLVLVTVPAANALDGGTPASNDTVTTVRHMPDPEYNTSGTDWE